jgi:hypothetical protein
MNINWKYVCVPQGILGATKPRKKNPHLRVSLKDHGGAEVYDQG